MPGLWSIVIPETSDITNMLLDGSFEGAGSKLTAMAGTTNHVSSDVYVRRGISCTQVTPSSGVYDGGYYSAGVSVVNGTTYTFSCDVWGVSGIPYRITFGDTSGIMHGIPTAFTGNNDWQRVSVTWVADATASMRLYITKNNHSNTQDFYVDGLILVALGHDVVYFDGDTPNCYWTGAKYNSPSIRVRNDRSGGGIYNLDTFNCFVSSIGGAGMPPIEQLLTKYASAAGALRQGSRPSVRVITLTSIIQGSSRADLHKKRKVIINAIKSDLVGGDQEFIFRYTGANPNKTIEIRAVYASGLEGDNFDGFTDEAPIKFICISPLFSEDGNAAAYIGTRRNISNSDYIVRRDNLGWAALGTGPSGSVKCMALSPAGELYIGGSFTTAGGVTVNNIARWTGTAWAALGGTPGTNGAVYAIAFAPNGDMFIGGAFTTAGGTTVNRIAKWNGSSWSAMGSGPGLNNDVKALCWDYNSGKLYVGGLFTPAGSDTGYRIASWLAGGNFLSVGSGGGVDGGVNVIVVAPSGNIAFGGAFSNTVDSHPCSKLGIVYTAYGIIQPIGSGVSGGDVFDIAYSPDGTLYVGGAFTTVGGGLAIAIPYLAQWIGSPTTSSGQWLPLGSTGINGRVLGMYWDKYRNGLFVNGSFTQLGGVTGPFNYVGFWNRYTWVPVDLNSPNEVDSHAFISTPNILYFGHPSLTTAFSNTNLIVNPGTATSNPTFSMTVTGGTETLKVIRNERTGAALYFNYTISDGETIYIYLSPTKKSIISSLFGEVIGRALSRASDLTDFNLLPGTNEISALTVPGTGSPSPMGFVYYPINHWSMDGVAV